MHSTRASAAAETARFEIQTDWCARKLSWPPSALRCVGRRSPFRTEDANGWPISFIFRPAQRVRGAADDRRRKSHLRPGVGRFRAVCDEGMFVAYLMHFRLTPFALRYGHSRSEPE